MSNGNSQRRIDDRSRMNFGQILRKVFLDDWLLKLIALAITLGLWFGVTGLSVDATKRLTVKLVPSVSNNVEVTNDPISEVDIVISGDERRMKLLNSTNLIASLDLTSVEPGDRVVSLTPDNVTVDLPAGIKLQEIQPSRIAVRLESVIERELPVRANVVGKPMEGYEVYGTTVTPQRVRVRGPVSFMNTLEFVLTDKVSIDGRDSDLTAHQVPLGVSNPKSTVFNTVVDVTVRIGEKRAEQSFTIPASPETNDRKVSVTLMGPKSALSGVKSQDIQVSTARSDAGEMTPQVTLPAEIRDKVEVKSARFR